MADPKNSGDGDERRKLIEVLDRLAAVQPGKGCTPDVLAGQWLYGDPDARRKIEETIDRLPKRPKSG